MPIRLRFALTLTLLGLLLFGGYAVFAYGWEVDDLHGATEREVRTLGRSLATSLGNALRDRQRADIDETLRALESLEPRIYVNLHDVDAREIARSRGEPVAPEIEARARSAAIGGRESVALEAGRFVYASPLTGDAGDVIGAIVVARATDDLRADLARTRLRLIIVVAAFVAVTLLAGVLLGTAYIARPLATLLDGVAHVRSGDFKSRVPPAHHDEIGALVDEFNTMVEALGDARQRVEQETEARLRLERGLQDIDKVVTIGQLSAGLAHEIGSPLQVLSARAEAIATRSSDPETRRQAEILVEQTARITRIVEQLLSFGRRRPAVIAPCDLARPVRTVLELLDGEVRRKGIVLELSSDAADHTIDADEDQLQQIVLNLVRNALAATPRGGRITVRIEGSEAVRTEAAPSEAAPIKAVPSEAAPIKAVPSEAAPIKAVPSEAVPIKAVPSEAAPIKAVASEAAPIKAVPSEAAPTKAVPSEAAPIKAVPSEAAPIKAVPSETAPAVSQVRLVVRDTGPGIPAEMATRLFEPFFTTRAAEGGTGLGLAVVRAIVRDHGGVITASSNQGAEFTVSFPVHTARVR